MNGIHIVRKSEASLPWSWFHCWVKLAKMHPSLGPAHLKAGSTFSAGAPSHVTEVLWQDWGWRLDASLAWRDRGREEQAVEWVPTWYRKLDFAGVTHADLTVMPWYTQLCFTREGTEAQWVTATVWGTGTEPRPCTMLNPTKFQAVCCPPHSHPSKRG